MNLFRKVAASITLVALVVSTGATGVSAYNPSEVTAANGLAAANVINDHAANTTDYNLASLLLRSEAAKIAVNLDGTVSMKTTCSNSFADVTATTPNTWACGYAEALLDAGKVSANTNFNPLSNLTKSEATKMFLEAAGCTDVYTNAANWQAETVAFAADNNIIASYSDYNTPATRGFVFEVAYNAMNTCPIEEVACDSVMEALGICTVETPADDDTTGDDTTGDDTTVDDTTVDGNSLKVALSSETPAGTDIADNINADVLKFDFTAGNEDVTVNSLTLKRNGLGSNAAVESVVLFNTDERVSKTKKFNSTTDLAEINLTSPVVVKAGETITLTARVHTINNADAKSFTISVESVNANVETEVSSIESEKFTVVKVASVTVTFAKDGNITNPKLGETQADLLKFKATNDGVGNEDVTITSMTFKENGGIREEDDLANLTLYFAGKEVATVASMSSKYVTFDFATPVVVKEDKTEKFVLKGDIIGGAKDTIEFFVDNTLDVTATASRNGNASVTNNIADANITPVTVQAGQVTITDTDPEYTDVLDNKDNVVFGTFNVAATTGKDLYVDSIAYTLTNTVNNKLATDLENVELYDVKNGVTYDPNETIPTTGLSKKFTFTDLDIQIENGSKIVFEIRADIKNNANANDKISASVDVAADVVVKESADDKAVTDKVPSAVSFKGIKIVAADMAVNALVESSTNVVVGAKNSESFKFEVRSNDDASDLKVKDLTIKGTVVDNGTANTDGTNFTNSRVNSLYLYEGGKLISSKSASELASSEVTFDDLNIDIAKNSAKTFTVTMDYLDDSNNAADTVNLKLVGYYIEDQESDNVYLAADTDKDGRLDDQGASIASTRTITIKGVGTLANVVDNTDTTVDKKKNVIAGSVSDFVASYELTAINEGVKIIDLEINETNGGVAFKDAVSEVVLYANDKTTEIARQIVTSDVVKFNNVNYVATEGSSNVYVKVVTHKIGKDQAGSQVADLTLKLKITDAEGASSAKTILGGDATNDISSTNALVSASACLAFSVEPVRISNVAFVSSANGVTRAAKLNNGDNNIAIIAITTDSNSNTDADDASSLKTKLNSIKLDAANYVKSATAGTAINSVSIEKINGTLASIAGKKVNATGAPYTVAAGSGAVDMFFGVTGVDYELENGSTTYFVVKANVTKDTTTDNDDYIKVQFDSLNGVISYQSDDTGHNDTPITDLRIGMTKLEGTQINE